MTYSVILTRTANRDLEDIADYIAESDSPETAGYVLNRLDQAIAGLAENPNRGPYPRELLTLGTKAFREIFFKPYRIIYQVMGEEVYVMLVADGRRDMRRLLERRMIE